MLRRILELAVAIVGGAGGCVLVLASQIDLSALPDPGPRETSMATSAKSWLIGRAARTS